MFLMRLCSERHFPFQETSLLMAVMHSVRMQEKLGVGILYIKAFAWALYAVNDPTFLNDDLVGQCDCQSLS